MRMRRINRFWYLLLAMLVSCAALPALAGIPAKDIVAAAEMISKVPTPAAKAYLEKQLESILNLPDGTKKEQEFQKFLAGLQPGAGSAAALTPATPVAPAKLASDASQVSVNSKIVDAKTQQEAGQLGMPIESEKQLQMLLEIGAISQYEYDMKLRVLEAAKAQPEAAQKLGIPVEKTLPKSGIVLRLIPAGTFVMGSPTSEKNRNDAEVQHTVKISKPFYMGKYEVTQGQWQKVMGNNPAKFKKVGENGPVEQVNWTACQEFIRKLEKLEGLSAGSMRLPTEAEWEYACRAGTQTAFCYGDDLDSSMANFNGNYPYGNGRQGEYRERTVPVGSFKPNAWGLYDMHGNVWEWCQDWYGLNATDDAVDPRGAKSGSDRVIRGGDLLNYARACRSANRFYFYPDRASSSIGFRLSLPAGQ